MNLKDQTRENLKKLPAPKEGYKWRALKAGEIIMKGRDMATPIAFEKALLFPCMDTQVNPYSDGTCPEGYYFRQEKLDEPKILK